MSRISVINEIPIAAPIQDETESYPAVGLISKVTEKDKSAFNELYARFSQVVFNLAYRILRDRGEAEEIVQEVFFQIWEKASTYNPGRGAEYTWIIKIARSRAIDRLRTLGFIRFNTEIDEERMNPKSDSSRIDEGRREIRAIIQRAIESLPEEQRVAIEMSYFDGFTHFEIAEKLGKPVGTIKTRLTLGVVKLRKQLGPYIEEL